MALLLAVALVLQLRTRRYTPWIYWLTVVLVSMVGTQITDTLTDVSGQPVREHLGIRGRARGHLHRLVPQ